MIYKFKDDVDYDHSMTMRNDDDKHQQYEYWDDGHR